MHILIAPDSFKESLTALEVAQAIRQGWLRIFPDAQVTLLPMADGGEGTVQSLVDATQGKLIEVEVTAPLGNRTLAFFGLSGDGKTAFIEMAAASGLHLVPREQRNPLITTSYGTGELILAALDYQVEKIILGIGGSATNDAGVGMLQALGASIVDHQQQPISFGGQSLTNIAQIDLSTLDKRLQQVSIEIACDVTNPLCGEFGASAIFGPQKGATPAMVKILDRALTHFGHIVSSSLHCDIATQPGSGAAGGMGAGLQLLPHVILKSGVAIVLDTVNFKEKVRSADLVITGEGCMDGQSVQGKTPVGVAKIAKQYHKSVIAIVGCLKEDYPAVYSAGIDAVFPILTQIEPLELALQRAEQNLIYCAENIARFYQLSFKAKES